MQIEFDQILRLKVGRPIGVVDPCFSFSARSKKIHSSHSRLILLKILLSIQLDDCFVEKTGIVASSNYARLHKRNEPL
ncbi:hypothetical protein D4Q52_18425 [Rhodopseudomonas palustris]|uniref:Uncharacterized protein n=1 Tax=Rhodopseudomonas palustris TaxID=1076 RepID=A0A418V1X5_RHOPL|nr:hypothetical protein D4Q52_18425 [Rhodopseudomonas palustris]